MIPLSSATQLSIPMVAGEPVRRGAAAALLLLLGLINAPPDPDSPKLFTCKYLIVGGGPGGMFAAYFLRSLGPDLCVVERSSSSKPGGINAFKSFPALQPRSVYGGKMMDFPVPPSLNVPGKFFGTGGLRIARGQTEMRCLMHQLNVSIQFSDWDEMFYTRGAWKRTVGDLIRSGAYPLLRIDAKTPYRRPPLNITSNEGYYYPYFFNSSTFNTSIDSMMSMLTDYVFLEKTDVNPVTGVKHFPHPARTCDKFATVMHYLRDTLGPEAAHFMYTAFATRGMYKETLDVCQFLEWMKYDARSQAAGEFYVTWSEVFEKIHNLAAAQGVRFFDGTTVTALYQTIDKLGAKKYIATTPDGMGFLADRLVINLSKENMQHVGGNLGRTLFKHPQMQAMKTQSMVLYNAYWPNRFWAPFKRVSRRSSRIMSDDFCMSRMEIPDHPYVDHINVTRPLYCDDPECVNMWQAIFEAGGLPAVRREVKDRLGSMFAGVPIPDPIADLYVEPQSFTHWLKPYQTRRGITINSIHEWSKAPLGPGNPIILVGEAYFMWAAAWAHGPLKSAIEGVAAQFRDVLEPAAWAEMQFVNSTCGRGPHPLQTFSNELYPEEGIYPGYEERLPVFETFQFDKKKKK